jgi:hypothetical protein
VLAPTPPEAPEADALAAGGDTKRRRRRSRSGRREHEAANGGATPAAPQKHQSPKLLTRIKQKLKRFFGF